MLASFVSISACKPTLLPSTNLADNKENRALVDFMLQYKGAVEKRNSEAVMALVSKDYFEDNGNLVQEDDYGYEGLNERLNTRFEHLKAIKLDLFIQNTNKLSQIFDQDIIREFGFEEIRSRLEKWVDKYPQIYL